MHTISTLLLRLGVLIVCAGARHLWLIAQPAVAIARANRIAGTAD